MKEQCIQFLLKAGIKPQSKYFKSANGQTILLRMICNLLAVSQNEKQSPFHSGAGYSDGALADKHEYLPDPSSI